MPLFSLTSLTLPTSSSTTSSPHSVIAALEKALNTLPSPPRFVLGTRVQTTTTVQVTASWPSTVSSPSQLPSHQDFQAFEDAIRTAIPASLQLDTTVAEVRSETGFEVGQPPVTEWVRISFPSSSTPAFKKGIEDDFARFEALFRQRGEMHGVGERGLAVGWGSVVSSQAPTDREESSGEGTGSDNGETVFVVARGWEAMADFETAVRTEAFDRAKGILMGWDAPFELVSFNVVRQRRNERLTITVACEHGGGW